MIRVQVVDDVALVSDATCLALRLEPDFQILGASSCAAEVMRQMHHADIALVNMHLRKGAMLSLS